jgi:hypothetical protein
MIGYRIRVASLEEPKDPLTFADRRKSARELAIPSAFRAYVKYMGLDKSPKKRTITQEDKENRT